MRKYPINRNKQVHPPLLDLIQLFTSEVLVVNQHKIHQEGGDQILVSLNFHLADKYCLFLQEIKLMGVADIFSTKTTKASNFSLHQLHHSQL
jgi:hypothetical protein